MIICHFEQALLCPSKSIALFKDVNIEKKLTLSVLYCNLRWHESVEVAIRHGSGLVNTWIKLRPSKVEEKSFLCSSSQVWHHLPRLLTKPVKRTLSKYHSKTSCLHAPPRPRQAKGPGWAMGALALSQPAALFGRAQSRQSSTPSWARHPPQCPKGDQKNVGASGPRPVSLAITIIASQKAQKETAPPPQPQPQRLLGQWRAGMQNVKTQTCQLPLLLHHLCLPPTPCLPLWPGSFKAFPPQLRRLVRQWMLEDRTPTSLPAPKVQRIAILLAGNY